MRKGDNISVYLKYDFLEELDQYALDNNLLNKFGKPNRSKALVDLAENELSEKNKTKRLIDKLDGRKHKS